MRENGSYEEFVSNSRRNNSQDLMEWAHRNNSRVHQIHQRGANSAVGGGAVGYEWMHYTRAGQFAQDGAAMIQNTGLFGGGSHVDLMYNTQRGIASMGGHISAGGRAMGHMGGGQTNDELSRALFTRFDEKLFSGGANNKANNIGRDPTEMGRIFAHMATQGAFGGMEITEFGEKSLEDRISSGVRDLRAQNSTREADRLEEVLKADDKGAALSSLKGAAIDDNYSKLEHVIDQIELTSHGFDDTKLDKATDDIVEKMKDFARVADSLEEVFGEMSEIDVQRTTQRLTGVGIDGNLKAARSEIESMKTAASALGKSPAEFLNQTMMNADAFTAAGMGLDGGALLARATTASAFRLEREHMVTAGIRVSEGGYGRRTTAAEISDQNVADIAGMSEEIETQTALEMQYRMQTDKDLEGDTGYQKLIDNIMLAETEGERSAAFAAANAENDRRGFGMIDVSTDEMRNVLKAGPGGAIFANLEVAQVQRTTKRRNMEGITDRTVRGNENHAFLGEGSGTELTDKMYRILDGKTRASLLEHMESGNQADIDGVLEANEHYLKLGGTTAEEMSDLIKQNSQAAGGLNRLGHGLSSFNEYFEREDQTKNMDNVMSVSNLGDAMNSIDMGKLEAGETQAKRKSSLVEKIMNGIMTGSVADIDVKEIMSFGAAAGGEFDLSMDIVNDTSLAIGEEGRAKLAKDKVFMREMGFSTREDLDKFMEENPNNNVSSLKKGLDAAGYHTGTTPDKPDSLQVLSAEGFAAMSDKVRQFAAKDAQEALGITHMGENATTSEATAEQLEKNRLAAQTALGKKFTSGGWKYRAGLITTALGEATGDDGDTSGLAAFVEAREQGLFDGKKGKNIMDTAFKDYSKANDQTIQDRLRGAGMEYDKKDPTGNVEKLIEVLIESKKKEDEARENSSHTYANAIFERATIHQIND